MGRGQERNVPAQRNTAVFHQKTVFCGTQHLGIVVGIAKGHHAFRRQAPQLPQRLQGGTFVDTGIHDVHPAFTGNGYGVDAPLTGIDRIVGLLRIVLWQVDGEFVGRGGDIFQPVHIFDLGVKMPQHGIVDGERPLHIGTFQTAENRNIALLPGQAVQRPPAFRRHLRSEEVLPLPADGTAVVADENKLIL